MKKGSPGRLLASDFSNEMVEPLQEEKAGPGGTSGDEKKGPVASV